MIGLLWRPVDLSLLVLIVIVLDKFKLLAETSFDGSLCHGGIVSLIFANADMASTSLRR